MAGAKVAATVVVSLIVLAVGASLAPLPFGKPSPWQLIAAPEVVNTEYLVSESGEADYTWTAHPSGGRVGSELENTATETILRGGTQPTATTV